MQEPDSIHDSLLELTKPLSQSVVVVLLSVGIEPHICGALELTQISQFPSSTMKHKPLKKSWPQEEISGHSICVKHKLFKILDYLCSGAIMNNLRLSRLQHLISSIIQCQSSTHPEIETA